MVAGKYRNNQDGPFLGLGGENEAMKRSLIFPFGSLISFIIIMLVVIAVINQIIGDEPIEELEVQEKFELTIWTDASETKMRRIMEAVESVYYDTVFIIDPDVDIQEKLAARDEWPDIVYVSDMDVLENLGENRNIEDQFLVISENAVPAALYYNKDLFDLFGVPYPNDVVTWEDLVPYIEKLTRFEYDKQFLGFAANPRMLYLYSSPPLPPPNWERDSEEVQVIEEEWKDWALAIKALFDAGYNGFTTTSINQSQELFIRERSLAMWAGDNIMHPLVNQEDDNWEWDLLPFPDGLAETENIQAANVPVYLIPRNGPNETEALLILSQLLQSGMKQAASLLEAAEQLEGKNIEALFENDFIKRSDLDYTWQVNRLMNAFVKIVTGESNVNSAVRTALEREEKTRQPQ